MLILETCVIIDYLRNKPIVVNFIETIGKNNFILPSPVIIELYNGVRDSKEFRTLQKKIQHFVSLEMDTTVSQIATQLAEKYALSHQRSLGDTLIAGTALVYQIELRVFNLKDFHFIPNLIVSNSLE